MNILLNSFNANTYVNKIAANPFVTKQKGCLAPLTADTVSFGASAKLIGGDMKFAPTESLCRQISENAEPARFFLETILEKYIGQYKFEFLHDDPKKKPIQDILTRTKSSSSIREKVVSKYSKCTRDEANSFAEQVVDLLSKNFSMAPNTDPEVVLSNVEQSTKYSFSDEIKMSPYSNVDLFFDSIIADLQLFGHYDFNAVPDGKRTSVFESIKRELEANNDDTHHVDKRFYDPMKIKGIKHWANDIVGGRIIMREPGPEYTGIVLEGLKQAVNDGVLKITSIENNIPNPNKLPANKSLEDYLYATNKQLKSLADAAGAPLQENISKSGYLSVHINIDLDDSLLEMYNGVFEGFSGEIQIIGEDVLKLKEVEDLCYKLKDNKNAINLDYKPFKDYFSKYYQGEQVQKAFDDYTYVLYLAQRSLPAGATQRHYFPSISELGFEGKVPPELDFNRLRTIKEFCDINHEENLKKQEEELKKKAIKDPIQRIKRKNDIDTVKKAISYTYS